jgi:hypothetical protein
MECPPHSLVPRNREQSCLQSFYTETVNTRRSMASRGSCCLELHDHISSHGIELARAIACHNRTQHL